MKSFKFAFEGLKTEFKKGRNFRIQIACGFLVIILGLILKLETFEWLSLILIITLVLILELVNTSLEAIVDLVSPEIHPKAKIAKDVAAGAVLVAAVASVVIGAVIFLPKLLSL
ncbi:MAG TPA: diacylglycerol kinase family protein [Alphaproteobacteria bacterium]|jgi:diacylglycerol kinase|nr:diacylglycerol kinase family protein [Alphaproteobacteria bacterium]